MSGSQVVNGGTLLRLWTPIRAWLAAQATKNCSWLVENINNRYSRFAKRIARKYLDWTFGIGFLTLILLIIYFKPDLFGAKPWPGIFWMVSGLLSSAAIYYLLARTIFPKAFPQRIRIRAFTPLREKSTYNGQAIARLLELEMQPPDKSKEAPSRVGSEPKVPSVNVSLAGTTIPLDFIWGRIDRWISGPIYTIEGIISESDRAITIDAWSTERAVHWRARSSPDLDCDPWRSAIVDLADQVRDSFGHYQELRDKRVDKSRYQESIYLA
jgi:hypothetical protein